jgi:hypothetical protein
VSVKAGLGSVFGGDILILSTSWITAQPTDPTDGLEALYEAGVPVIVLEDQGTASSRISSGDVRAVGQYKSPATGEQYSYTVETMSLGETLKRSYNWADYVLSENEAAGETIAYSSASPIVYNAYGDKEAGEFAWYSVRTIYTEKSSTDTTKSYWDVNYKMLSEPKANNYRTTGLNIKSEYARVGCPSTLFDYGPTTTSGTSTVAHTIGISAGASSNGVVSAGINFSRTVSYAIPDVQVHDHSSFIQNKAEWFHQINAGSNSAKDTYYIQPGAIITGGMSVGNSYHYSIDEYRGEYRKTTLLGYSDYSSFTLSVVVDAGGFMLG